MPTDGVAEPLSGVFLARLDGGRANAQRDQAILLRHRTGQQGKRCWVTAAIAMTPRPICSPPWNCRASARSWRHRPHSPTPQLSPGAHTGRGPFWLVMEAGDAAPAINGNGDERAIAVSPLDAELLDAVVRLVRLVERPGGSTRPQAAHYAEIVYRLLEGEQGGWLRHMVVQEGYTPHIAAIERLRRDYDQPLRMEQLAGDLGMSVSSFHHRFKDVTAMSPLQYQKRIRLRAG